MAWTGRGWPGGRRRALAAFAAVTAAAGPVLAAGPAAAAPVTAGPVCVGSGTGCYRTIQAAVSAAHDGDTITVGPGTFAGGVTITKSVRLRGAGPRSTVIRGGAHVLTIGRYGAAAEPVVSVSGVTITGGLARSSPESVPFTGKAGVWAAGGGIEIPPGAHLADGATVTITHSVITGNRVDPANSVPSGIKCPGHFPKGQCPFAPAFGGGIDSWGALTLNGTAVIGNGAGAVHGQPGSASDADGGGLYSRQGGLMLKNAVVSGNQATAASPAGRFAEGGGIWAGVPDFGPGTGSGRELVVIRNSVITGNTARLSTDLPASFGGQVQNLVANTGGVLVAGRTRATTVEDSVISGNSAIATDPHGEGGALDAGMNVTGGTLAMSGSAVTGNRAITRTGTSACVAFAGGALEVDGGGTIRDTRITGNVSSTDSQIGRASCRERV